MLQVKEALIHVLITIMCSDLLNVAAAVERIVFQLLARIVAGDVRELGFQNVKSMRNDLTSPRGVMCQVRFAHINEGSKPVEQNHSASQARADELPKCFGRHGCCTWPPPQKKNHATRSTLACLKQIVDNFELLFFF